MRLILLGVGYFPHRVAGDKNFFLELVPRLATHVDDLAVASVNDVEAPVSWQELPGNRSIPIYNFCRPFHSAASRRRHSGIRSGIHYYHHKHRLPQEMLEKSLSLLVHQSRLRRIVREHRTTIIHFMDNFGPGMPLSRHLFPTTRLTFAAAAYVPRGSLYSLLLRNLLRGMDGVLTYTEAYRHILMQLGVSPERVTVTPWGVDPHTQVPLSDAERTAQRVQLGIGPADRLVVWAGFIQQLLEPDFYRALEAARAVLQRDLRVHFLFAFKPENWRPRYAREAGERLTIHDGLPDFRRTLAAADVLFSPIGNLASTASPPLTWLEAMSMGVPVLTTGIGGVREVIQHGVSGFIAPRFEDVPAVALAALARDDLRHVGVSARETVLRDFNLDAVAPRYVAAWQRLAQARREF